MRFGKSRTLDAAARGYEPRHGKLAEGDTVRIAGVIGERFKVLGFRDGVAELWGLGQHSGQRSIPVERLVPCRAFAVTS